MNREIKFRVWNKIRRIWDVNFRPDITKELGDYNTRIVQQFTGLRDKNGREIYEGDILTGPDLVAKGKVVYDESTAKFLISFDLNENKINPDNSLMFGPGWDCQPSGKKLKVIGNVFENPELLK
jgi:uncharacterized phage protein (TIGR01671 family)